MGVKKSLQTGGNLLNLLSSILTVLSTSTNYWIRQQGGHSGLWQECTHGTCSNIPCQSESLTRLYIRPHSRSHPYPPSSRWASTPGSDPAAFYPQGPFFPDLPCCPLPTTSSVFPYEHLLPKWRQMSSRRSWHVCGGMRVVRRAQGYFSWQQGI